MDPIEAASENTSEDLKQDGPIESPFKLIKVKGNNSLPVLGLNPSSNLTPSSPSSKSPSSDTVSSLSPTSPTTPSSTGISLNPFTLSKLKKTTTVPVNGTTIPRISPLSVIGKDVSPEQQIAELQNEVACLKKEIESKDAKLSSSMRSIKMFWSPELKKERAAHKEDVERMLLLKNQYDSLQTELKKAKGTEQENEGATSNADVENDDSLKVLKDELEKVQLANEKLKSDLLKCKEKSSNLKKDREAKDEELLMKKNVIEDLQTQVKGLRVKESESLLFQDNLAVKEEKLSKLQTKLNEKDEEIEHFSKRIKLLEEGRDDFTEIVKRKESLIKDLQEKEEQLQEQNKMLAKNCQEAVAKFVLMEKKVKEKSDEIETCNEQTSKLKLDLESSIDECQSLQKTLEDTRNKILELCEDLEKTKEQAETKEEELSSLREEVQKMKITVEEKDNMIKDNEEALTRLKVSRRKESVEVQDLKCIADDKSKELESLSKKYDALDTYLSHRETALSHARDELNEVKSKHANCTTTISFMENQIADKDKLIARLEKQRNRLEKEKEEEAYNTVNNKEQIETKMASLSKQLEEKETLVKELEDKVTKLQVDLENSEKMVQSSEDVLQEKEKSLETLSEDLAKAKESIKNLELSLNEKKNNDENDRNSLKVVDDTQKRYSANSPVKDGKIIKQLWDEIAKKDSKLQDLEKQLKDRGKQLTTLRKTQNLEKQTQFLTDRSKRDGDNVQTNDLKEELGKRDERIAMLEDALRESVSIAAEREELLAQHVEFSEEAAQSIRELETDTDRLTMEKGITNIKNWFLILSLAERDALLASLKAMKKRNMEELMNIKQTALLAAISEKDSNIALLELQSSSKSRKQEIKQCKQEKDKLVNELKEQTQQRIIITNNEDNKDELLYKELEEAPNELILQALRRLTDSSDKLEYYIEALISFVKEKNLEILKEMPTLQKRSQKSTDKLRNASKGQLLRELQRCEEDCSQLKSYVDILLEKLEG